MRQTIRLRLFKWFIVVSVIPLLVIGGVSYYFISKEISKQTEEKITSINTGIKNMVDTQQKVTSLWLESSASSFSYKLETLGKSRFDYNNMLYIAGHRIPTWYLGKQKLTNDYSLVDQTLEKENLETTIFMLDKNEFVRVSTSVRQPDGARIMGTLINSGLVYNKLIRGQQYIGRASVEGIWHATIYRPILNNSGEIIGAFVLGRREQEYEMISAIKRISIGESGYVYVFDSNTNAIIHPYLNGQAMKNYPWVKEIIKNKEGTIEYTFNGKNKIATYTYYEPWDWYIVTGGNKSEIFSTSKKLYNLILVALIIVTILSLFISYLLSKSFSRPIKKLMGVMEEIQDGDLSQKLIYVNNDEFGTLNRTFNTMLSNISILIGKILYNAINLKEASNRLKSDISKSKDALKGIENGLDSIDKSRIYVTEKTDNAYKTYEEREYFDDFVQIINGLRMEIEEVIVDKKYENLENIKLELNDLEDAILNLNKCNDENETLSVEGTSFENRVDNLKIEVEKLNMLLDNISSSGNMLDQIALDLDNHINIFKIQDKR
ncbi:MAG TPA: Cache 3/Cache 2 fusion domain-containing protein [Clostridium sp.]|uniref:Cache 3/Cache 2 fusion domain-containing protein n=1 Tax=Clostridium sp. TaxID=1506 RepID=UPI002F95310B